LLLSQVKKGDEVRWWRGREGPPRAYWLRFCSVRCLSRLVK